MKKSIMLATTLAVLASTNFVHAAGSSSLNPRDINTTSIPGSMMNSVVTRFTDIELGTVIETMEKNGETESKVMAKINAEGSIFFERFRGRNLNKFMNDGESNFIPFKIEAKSDGSYEASVGLYRYRNNREIDNSKFWGWLSVTDIELLKQVTSNDKTRGLKRDDGILIDMEGRIGIYQNDNKDHNLFIKAGVSAGSGNQDYLTKDGSIINIDGNLITYKAGLHYSHGNIDDGLFEMGAGVKIEKRDGNAMTAHDYARFDADTNAYNNSFNSYNADTVAYDEAKSAKEAELGLSPGDLSDDTFSGISGMNKPSFDLADVQLTGSRLEAEKVSAYGLVKYSAYFRDANIRLGFSLDIENNMSNEITGSDMIYELQDNSQANLKVKLEF